MDVDEDVATGLPFLADLDGDGTAEVVGSAAVTSALDGRTLFTYNRASSGSVRAVAADLNLDGFPEIVTEVDQEPAIRDGQGILQAVCPILETSEYVDGNMIFAVGNLDDDAEGEVAVVRPGILAICEADGTVRASVATDSGNTSVVAIAELTGDDLPELVVDEFVSGTGESVAAYDRDLRLLWRHELGESGGKAPFAVVDLDGDGLHEVLVHRGNGGLSILAPDGNELASADGPQTGGIDVPIVTDLDGDGLAEIVIAGERPNLTVYTNDAGGWPVSGAQDPWPGVDHFPGDRNLDGTLPDPADVPWLVPGYNVWQGLAPGREALPDLGVELIEACSDDCETTQITAWVSNHGAADDPVPITVALYRLEDGTLLASEVLDQLPTGLARAVEFRVASAELGEGVRAVVEGTSAECTDIPNEAVLTDLPCAE